MNSNTSPSLYDKLELNKELNSTFISFKYSFQLQGDIPSHNYFKKFYTILQLNKNAITQKLRFPRCRLTFFFLSSEESDTFSVNLTQRQSCNFLDSYNLHIYAFNDLFMYLFI